MLVVFLAAVCMLAAAQPPGARAAGGIDTFSFLPSSTQAGGHPDISAGLDLGAVEPPEAAKSLTLEAPTGLNLMPFSVVRCTAADFASTQCPSDSQVGIATVSEDDEEGGEVVLGTAPVYSVMPAGDAFGRLGFVIPTVAIPVSGPITIRTGSDYGVRLSIDGFSQSAPMASLELRLWGVPAAPVNDAARFPSGSSGCPGSADTSCNMPTPSSIPQSPFIENPTRCSDLLAEAAVMVTTHEDPGNPAVATAPFAALTGCDLLSFDPSADVALTTEEARSATGLDLDLKVPQTQSPVVPAPSQLRHTAIFFEDGVWLGFGAEDLGVCTYAESSIGTEELPSCPDAALIGTAAVGTELAPDPLSGNVYFAGEEDDGALVALLLVAGSGFELKLPFFLEEDPVTGEAIVVFEDLPQIPIDRITVHLGAEGELFETVNECGEFTVWSLFVPWDEALSPQVASTPFELTSGPGGTPCPGPASDIAVSLSPTGIVADGVSTSTATAHVSDENGAPVIGDLVEFISSDSGQKIGPVTESEDGVYTARIVASTTPGTVTITAVDKSVEPAVTGQATLEQVGASAPRSSPPPQEGGSVSVTRIRRHPRRRSPSRRAVFAFVSTIPGSKFFCSVDRKPYRRCTSPKRLRKLKRGKHRFRVYAVSPGGRRGHPAVFRFTVVKPRRGRKSARRRASAKPRGQWRAASSRP